MSWQTDTVRVATPTRTPGAPTPDAKRRPRVTRLDWGAAGIAAIALIVRIWLTLRGWPALDSDEAIVGLMARHILYNGEHPIFYYGQHYMGALEAYLAVPFFWLLGPTQLALRLAMLTLVLPFLVCVYLLGRATYGRTVGLLSLAALALGPAFGLMREAPAIGGYQETLLFGALLPLIAYQRLRSPLAPASSRAIRRASIAQYAVFGLIAGLGIWSDELILVFIATPLLALALARQRELFWPPALVALASGVLVGGAPFIGYNLLRHGQTFVELAVQERSSHLGLHQLLAQVGSTLSLGLPATFGSPQVCVAPGSLYAGYASYPLSLVIQAAASTTCQMTGIANILFSLLILGVYALAAVPVIRALVAARPWRDRLPALFRKPSGATRDALLTPTRPMRSAPPATAGHSTHMARLWLRGMLILAALGTLAQYALSRRGVGPDQFVAIRYLLPLYITLPVVIGPLVDAMRAGMDHLRRRGAQRSDALHRRATTNAAWGIGTVLASGTLALLLALFLVGGAASVVTASDSSRFALPSVQDQQMMRTLQQLGVSSYYGNYWMCYNLAFESGEQLHCSTYGRVERYHPYAVYLSHTQHPAYVLQVGSADDTTFQRTTAPALAREGYAHTQVDGFDIYYLPQ